MKKLLLIFCLCAVVILPQTLRKVVTESFNPHSSVFFVDENTGWISGSSENILKTTDGGNTWTLQYENTAVTNSFSSIHFLDSNIGFAGGGSSASAKLIKTTDGGANWVELTPPDTMSIVKIYFADVNTGWILTNESNTAHIVKTTDGGNTWTQVMGQTTGDMEDLFMLPSGRGIAVGGGVGKIDIYYTSDGTTWTKAPAPTLGGFTYSRTDIKSVYMVNDNLAYTCGWGSSAAGLQPNILLKSTDGGATWTYLTQTPENRIYVNLNSLIFKDELNGLAFGGSAYEGTVIARTTDGGTNWIPIPTGTGFTAQDGYNVGNKVWVVGASGGISYSENFGDSWTLKTPIIGSTLNDMIIVNNKIIAGGFSGLVVKSTDNGINWTSNFAAIDKICPHINGLYFINDNTGFAARNNRLVSKTTDGGINWTRIMSDTMITGMTNNGVYFFDENTGYVAGKIANNVDAIYKTTDGGNAWSLKSNTAGEDLNDIHFADANKGAAVGNDSKILFTSDGGANWASAVITDLPSGLQVDIFSVTFMNSTNGVAVGENCIFNTNDGGANWKYIVVAGLDKDLDGVAFKDENEGWAVGEDGLILHTTDGGNAWVNVSDTLVTGSGDLYAVAIDNNGYPWIAAGSSTIYTTAPFVAVNDKNPMPVNFYLEQNYPNPFNPSTTIKYSVASESKVTLRVYDILGNLVEELVNKNLPAGEYSVNFDAASLSSGIYFSVMNAGGKVLTRKMTLIK